MVGAATPKGPGRLLRAATPLASRNLAVDIEVHFRHGSQPSGIRRYPGALPLGIAQLTSRHHPGDIAPYRMVS